MPSKQWTVIRPKILSPLTLLAGLGLALAIPSPAAPASPEPNAQPEFHTDQFVFSYSLQDGRWDLWDADHRPILQNAEARVILESGSTRSREITSSGRAERSWEKFQISAPQGDGIEFQIKSKKRGEPALIQGFDFFPGQRFFTLRLILDQIPARYRSARIKALEPMRVQGPSGGLFVGPHPDRHQILDNGSNLYLDVMVSRHRPGHPPLPARLLSRDSKSNSSSIIYDPETGRSALAGFLSSGETADLIIAGARPGGRAFSHYGAQASFRPPLRLGDRESFSSNSLYLDFFAADPFSALEDYASAMAREQGIKLWPGPIPAGWNSWGEYFTRINETIMLQNLDFAAEHFRPFGLRYFQIDAGYYPAWGDWEADLQRFPHGMKWMAEQIRARGMIPGIWIGPLCAETRSKIFQQHPDWFLPRQGLIPRLMIQAEGADLRVLDLSKPEVKDHLRQVIRTCVRDWGYQWLKIDFAYFLLYYRRLPDSSRTVPAVYREALRIIKEEAGPDVFVVGIGPVAFNYGLADGQRITLDNMPAWNNRESSFIFNPLHGRIGFAQGIVPTVRTMARRYWLNYREWINHPDMIFFNNDRWPDWGPRPLTFEQARAFASIVGLTGGIVKIGDRMVEMSEPEVDVIRRLLPVYRGSARPLDLFEKETPELWDLKVATEWDRWEVVGLFNWGKNWSQGKKIPAATRTLAVEFSRLGLEPSEKYLVFDFWGEKFLGVAQDRLSVEVGSETARVLAVRKLPDHPWFLSYNRHLSQGGVEIKALHWDRESGVLSGTQEVAAGYEYHLYFYRPDSFRLVAAEVEGAPAKVSEEGPIARLSFTPPSATELKWELRFRQGS